MNFQVAITSAAESDMETSALWWAEHRSVEQAIRWLDGIRARIESLTENPLRCPLAAENGDGGFEYRELHFGLGVHVTHRILFFILNDIITVVAVRHVAQDRWEP